jgi:hypothetical protein
MFIVRSLKIKSLKNKYPQTFFPLVKTLNDNFSINVLTKFILSGIKAKFFSKNAI